MGIDFSHFDKGDYEFAILLIGVLVFMYRPYFSKLVRKNGLKPFLTTENHLQICQVNQEKIKEDIKNLLNEKVGDLKEFINKDIKIAILEEMRKPNGK